MSSGKSKKLNTTKVDDKDSSSEKEPSSQIDFPKTISTPDKKFVYVVDSVVGQGSFGVVVKAILETTGEVVALKKVLQDKRYKNRELQIMQMLNHRNIIQLKNNFFTEQDKDLYLTLALEFMPDTVYRFSRQYSKIRQKFSNYLPEVICISTI